MDQRAVNNKQCKENTLIDKLKFFFRLSTLSVHKPVLLAWLWLIVILAVFGVIIFKFYGLQPSKNWDIALILVLLFLLLMPIPLITFPLIIVSIMNKTRQCQNNTKSIMYIDSRQIVDR